MEFEQLTPYRLNLDFLKDLKLLIKLEHSDGKKEEKEEYFFDILKLLNNNPPVHALEPSANDYIRRIQASTFTVSIDHVIDYQTILELFNKHKDRDPGFILIDWYFLFKDHCLVDPLYSYTFFISCGDEIIEEKVSLGYDIKGFPEELFHHEEVDIWDYESFFRKARAKLAADNFYKTNFGKIYKAGLEVESLERQAEHQTDLIYRGKKLSHWLLFLNTIFFNTSFN